jgi:hypothetical protein
MNHGVRNSCISKSKLLMGARIRTAESRFKLSVDGSFSTSLLVTRHDHHNSHITLCSRRAQPSRGQPGAQPLRHVAHDIDASITRAYRPSMSR